MTRRMAADRKRVECPICNKHFAKNTIDRHVNQCLNSQENVQEEAEPQASSLEGVSACKKSKTGDDTDSDRVNDNVTDSDNKVSPKYSVTLRTEPESAKLAAGNGIESPKFGEASMSCSGSRSSRSSKIEAQQSESQRSVATKGKVNNGEAASVWKTLMSSGKQLTAQTPNKMRIESPKKTSPSLLQLGSKPAAASCDRSDSLQAGVPLAEKLRPQSLEDYSGQEKVVGQNQVLRQLLESAQLPSMILWGPPGCGKTTLAKIVAKRCKEKHGMRYVEISATTAGIADVKDVVKTSKNDLKLAKRRTLLFIDEIHRFNKLQQDALLPHVEDGTFVLIGATTENPSFRVNNALLSRCKLIVLESLSVDSIQGIIRRAISKLDIQEVNEDIVSDGYMNIHTEAIDLLAKSCDGDARRALMALQTACDLSCTEKSDITVEIITKILHRSHLRYDRNGDEHYDCASALQKSIRGSSDSAAIYYLARMMEGGEDPMFIARRLLVCASEDIGLADPQALPIAVAAFQACQFLGAPECIYNLSHCAAYLARAPKSADCTKAYQRAKQCITEHQGPQPGVPLHLRNAPTTLMKDLGYGKGYKYNHNFTETVVQEYLPAELKTKTFFD